MSRAGGEHLRMDGKVGGKVFPRGGRGRGRGPGRTRLLLEGGGGGVLS